MRHPMRPQPLAQRQEIGCHRAERFGRPSTPTAIIRRAHRRDHCRLMHIQTGTPRNHEVIVSLLLVEGARRHRLCSTCSQQQYGVPQAPASDSAPDLPSTNYRPTSSNQAHRVHVLFMLRGERSS
jgi:hypothetical protein